MTELRPVADIAAQRLDDEIVLVHLRTNAVYRLNDTGGRIWELIGEGLDRDHIVSRLGEEFEVPQEQLVGEVDALVADLMAEGLIEVTE